MGKTNSKYGSLKRQFNPGTDELDLGPLELLRGTWANIRPEDRLDKNKFISDGTLTGQGQSPFDGRGWNLIALPFAEVEQRRNYRLLLNQYNEVITFSDVDDNVPNRGITDDSPPNNADQFIAALDYEQVIVQIASKDVSDSGEAGDAKLPIHHEPGLFLHMKNETTNEINLARLATIPHGNAVTAIGQSTTFSGPPAITSESGLPEGVLPGSLEDLEEAVLSATNEGSYLFPYNQFQTVPFTGVVPVPGFPGFKPFNTNELLSLGIQGLNVKQTTELDFSTDRLDAGIVNIPFVEKQADAALMRAKFWIMELEATEDEPEPNPLLAYSQFIFLDFFRRRDGGEGLIRWPHISINVMEKIEEPNQTQDHKKIFA